MYVSKLEGILFNFTDVCPKPVLPFLVCGLAV